jgi:4-amino-4-deoxy-L-arabinose transferase-like glycosyltransferase
MRNTSAPFGPLPQASPMAPSAIASSPMAPLPPWALWLVAGLLAIVWFAGLGHRPLLSPDEGRYAEIAREMAVGGDWITPRLNGLLYFEKPPLQYWVTALALRIFGAHDWVVRLYPAAIALGAALAIGWMRRRTDGMAAAQAAALFFASFAWVNANAHFASLDGGLCAWLTLALLGLTGCIEGRPRAWLALWIGMAAAFLSKGLIALVIPAAALFATALWLRTAQLLRHVHPVRGMALFVVLVAPWLALVSDQHPSFLHFFFIHEHFERFASEVHDRVQPAWYFVPVLILGLLPWTGHAVAALAACARSGQGLFGQPAWRWPMGWQTRQSPNQPNPAQAPEDIDPAPQADPAPVLWIAWSIFVFGFFSASGSKLPSYILPMFPALALWLARRIPTLTDAAMGWALAAPGLTVLALAAGTMPLLNNADSGEPVALAPAYLPWIVAACAVLALSTAAAWRFRGRTHRLTGIAILALGSVASIQCLQWGHAVLGERLSARALVERVRTAEGDAPFDPRIPFYAVATWDQSLPFYLGRTLRLVDWRDEMDLGLREEPSLNGPTQAELKARWPELHAGYAVMDLATLARWQAEGIALREVARNTRRAVIAPDTRPLKERQ